MSWGEGLIIFMVSMMAADNQTIYFLMAALSDITIGLF